MNDTRQLDQLCQKRASYLRHKREIPARLAEAKRVKMDALISCLEMQDAILDAMLLTNEQQLLIEAGMIDRGGRKRGAAGGTAPAAMTETSTGKRSDGH